jgi:hypothetical protein
MLLLAFPAVFVFVDFDQFHSFCFTPAEVESLRCEITVRCVGVACAGLTTV